MESVRIEDSRADELTLLTRDFSSAKTTRQNTPSPKHKVGTLQAQQHHYDSSISSTETQIDAPKFMVGKLVQRSVEESNQEKGALLNQWAPSPTPSLSNEQADLICVSPRSSGSAGSRRSFPDLDTIEIRVENGLIDAVPRQLRISSHRMPCAIFALKEKTLGRTYWLFAKEYEQLENFNDLVQHLLVPLTRKTGFRPKQFPTRNMFKSNSPWKVDVRNDMLNGYFKSLLWVCDNCYFKENKVLQNELQQALKLLCFYDKVVPAPVQFDGFYGEEMCGFLLSPSINKTKTIWECNYYATNGGFLDVIGDIATGEVTKAISLYNAYIEKWIVMYEPRTDNIRYAINIYEVTSEGKTKLHTLCAENESTRQKWLQCLGSRASKQGETAQKRRDKSRKHPLPYKLTPSTSASPFLLDVESRTWNKNRRNSTVSPSSHNSLESLPSPSGMQSSESSSDKDLAANCPIAEPSKVVSTPVPAPSLLKRTQSNATRPEKGHFSSLQGADIESVRPMASRDTASNSAAPAHRAKRFSMSGALKSSGKHTKDRSGVFGVMPSVCVHRRLLHDHYNLPSVVTRCIELLYRQKGITEIGIFRISGTQKKLDELESIFDTCGDYDMQKGKVDVHTTADLLKRYLRKLPKGLINADYSEVRIQSLIALGEAQQLEILREDIKASDFAEYSVLKVIMKLLYDVSKEEKKNAMGLHNVGVALSPSIRIPVPVLELIIEKHKLLFS